MNVTGKRRRSRVTLMRRYRHEKVVRDDEHGRTVQWSEGWEWDYDPNPMPYFSLFRRNRSLS